MHEGIRTQDFETCSSFEWQWTEKAVYDSDITMYRKLFQSRYLWHDFYDGKTVADVGSGNGRFSFFLARLTRAKVIISLELSPKSIEKQKGYITDPRVVFIEGDMASVKFQADIIFAAGVIQHTEYPRETLRNLIDNLNDGGEIIISFYMKTLTTLLLRPLRSIFSRLPKGMLWALTPLLAPIFMVRPAGRESGFKNARHTAYDWFGSHSYQFYFTEELVRKLFLECGIDSHNILRVSKGIFRAKKGIFPLNLDSNLKTF